MGKTNLTINTDLADRTVSMMSTVVTTEDFDKKNKEFSEKIEDLREKVDEIVQKALKTSKKVQKNEENIHNLQKNVEEIISDIAANYIDTDNLSKREYLISTKFRGAIKNRKLKKEFLSAIDMYKIRVTMYDQTAIRLVFKMLEEAERTDALLQKYC